MAEKKRKAPIQRPRRRWTRSPAQKPHSTKKGARGYDRRRQERPPGIEEDEQ